MQVRVIFTGLFCLFTAPVQSFANNPLEELTTRLERAMEKALYPHSPSATQRRQGLPTASEIKDIETRLNQLQATIQRQFATYRAVVDPHHGQCQTQRSEAQARIQANENTPELQRQAQQVCFDEQMLALTIQYFQWVSNFELIRRVTQPELELATQWNNRYALVIPVQSLADLALLTNLANLKKSIQEASNPTAIPLMLRLQQDTRGRLENWAVVLTLKPDSILDIEDQVQFTKALDQEGVIRLGRYISAKGLFTAQNKIYAALGRDQLPEMNPTLKSDFPVLDLIRIRQATIQQSRASNQEIRTIPWVDMTDLQAQKASDDKVLSEEVLVPLVSEITPNEQWAEQLARAVLTRLNPNSVENEELRNAVKEEISAATDMLTPQFFEQLLRLWDAPGAMTAADLQTSLSNVYMQALRLSLIYQFVSPADANRRANNYNIMVSTLATNLPSLSRGEALTAAAQGFRATFDEKYPFRESADKVLAPLFAAAEELKEKLANIGAQDAEVGILNTIFREGMTAAGVSGGAMTFASALSRQDSYSDAREQYFLTLAGVVDEFRRSSPHIRIPNFLDPEYNTQRRQELEQSLRSTVRTSSNHGLPLYMIAPTSGNSYRLSDIERWINETQRFLVQNRTNPAVNSRAVERVNQQLPRAILEKIKQVVVIGKTLRFFQTEAIEKPKVSDLQLDEDGLKNYREVFQQNFLTVRPLLGRPIREEDTRTFVQQQWDRLWPQDARPERLTFQNMTEQNANAALYDIETNIVAKLNQAAATRNFDDIGVLMTQSVFIQQTFQSRADWQQEFRRASLEYFKPSLGNAAARAALDGASYPAIAGFVTMGALLFQRWSAPIRTMSEGLQTAFKGRSAVLYALFGTYLGGELIRSSYDWSEAQHVLDQTSTWYLTNTDSPSFMQQNQVEAARQIEHDAYGNWVFARTADLIAASFSIRSIRMAYKAGTVARADRRIQQAYERVRGLGRETPREYYQRIDANGDFIGRDVFSNFDELVYRPTREAIKANTTITSSQRSLLLRRLERDRRIIYDETAKSYRFLEEQIGTVEDSLKVINAQRSDFYSFHRIQSAFEGRFGEILLRHTMNNSQTTGTTLPRLSKQDRQLLAHYQKHYNRIVMAQARVAQGLIDAPLLRSSLAYHPGVGQHYRDFRLSFHYDRHDMWLRRAFPESFSANRPVGSLNDEMHGTFGLTRQEALLVRTENFHFEPSRLDRLFRRQIESPVMLESLLSQTLRNIGLR